MQTLIRFFVGFLVLLSVVGNTAAQDYTTMSLPEGAKSRLGKGWISEITYSPDGTRLAVAGGIGIWIYDAQTGEELDLLTGHTGDVESVSFSPDGRTLASGSWDDTVILWDVNTGEERRTLTGHTGDVESVSFSPDGRTLASGSWDDTVILWDVNTGEERRTLTGHTGDVNTVSFSPDGRTLASGSDDRTVILWDVNTGEERRTLTGHTGDVNTVSFSPDGRTLASGSDDDTVILWDVNTGEERRTLTGHTGDVNTVSFSPDGRTLASGSDDDTVILWDVNTGEERRTLTGHTGDVNTVSFSPDGRTLASGSSDRTVILWDVNTGEHRRTLTGHRYSVESVSFSPDGRTLASGSYDGTVLLWQLAPTTADANPIALEVPEELLISNVAFGPKNATYFVLNAMYPKITGVEPDEVHYGDCTITLDFEGVPDNTLSDNNLLPVLLKKYLTGTDGKTFLADQETFLEMMKALAAEAGALDAFSKGPQYFIFPLHPQTAEERIREAQQAAKAETLLFTISHLVGLIPVYGAAINWAADLSVIQYKAVVGLNEVLMAMMDPVVRLRNVVVSRQIRFPGIRTAPGRPNDIESYVLILPKGVGDVGEIGVKVKQAYMLSSREGGRQTATYEGRYNLRTNEFAAPPKHLTALSDYPPFQLLSGEVQTFLLHYFSRSMDAVDRPLPERTVLLPNYPNPFNPETWLPYALAQPSDVSISIYSVDGGLVRRLDLGYQSAGMYVSRGRAAYWDGTNDVGESVASGVYFYTLTAGDFSATRKLLIRK